MGGKCLVFGTLKCFCAYSIIHTKNDTGGLRLLHSTVNIIFKMHNGWMNLNTKYINHVKKEKKGKRGDAYQIIKFL